MHYNRAKVWLKSLFLNIVCTFCLFKMLLLLSISANYSFIRFDYFNICYLSSYFRPFFTGRGSTNEIDRQSITVRHHSFFHHPCMCLISPYIAEYCTNHVDVNNSGIRMLEELWNAHFDHNYLCRISSKDRAVTCLYSM